MRWTPPTETATLEQTSDGQGGPGGGETAVGSAACVASTPSNGLAPLMCPTHTPPRRVLERVGSMCSLENTHVNVHSSGVHGAERGNHPNVYQPMHASVRDTHTRGSRKGTEYID